jgi:hypothetical protein
LAADADASPPRFETYAGANYEGRAANLTTTTVWSILGPVTEPGFRIKLDGLADVYGEEGTRVFSKGFQAAGLKAIGDIMAGYQFEYGPMWIKIYAGAASRQQIQLFWQAGQLLQQQEWGAAAAIETYWQASDRIWAAASLSWQQPDNLTTLYSRAAYEIYRSSCGLRVSTGAEAGLTVSNADDFKEGKALDLFNDYVKGGALLNLRYGVNELTFSGGVSQVSDDQGWHPYVTISFGRKF